MSLEQEDAELFRLERAAEYMREIRLAQAERGRKFIGVNRISEYQKRAITQAVDKSALVAAVKASAQIDLPVNRLAERFEEMCRRQGSMVSEELRPSIVKLLATELWVNHKVLRVRAEKLLSATLHQGAVALELLRDFPEHPAYLITCAMQGSPASSREFLRRIGEQIEALSSDPEFSLLAKNRPSEFAHTIAHSPLDARVKLREVQEELKKENWVEDDRGRSRDGRSR